MAGRDGADPGPAATPSPGHRRPRCPSDPTELLRADPRAVRLLEGAVRPPGPVAAGWDCVLGSLTVLAVRAHDLDALATVLRCGAEFGLTADPVLRGGAGFLCAQQGPDGAFGGPGPGSEPDGPEPVCVPLTRHSVAALRRWL